MATRGAGYRPSGQHFDPTRLRATGEMVGNVPPYVHDRGDANAGLGQVEGGKPGRIMRGDDDRAVAYLHAIARSEEHTSELQSLMRISYAVFCLKKKKH